MTQQLPDWLEALAGPDVTQEDREAAKNCFSLTGDVFDRLRNEMAFRFAQYRRAALAAQWRPLSDTAWIDGRDVVLLAHDMEVQARYCPGEWSDETPISPREYSGAVWSCFDDQFQFEIEETSDDPAEWHHGQATHWREPTRRPVIANAIRREINRDA